MNRSGFALPLALVVLVAVSMMVATAMQVSLSDFYANRSMRMSDRALYAAEAGTDRTLATWTTVPFSTLAPGASLSSGWTLLPDGSTFQSVVTRLDPGATSTALYRVLVEGRPSRQSAARRSLIAIVQSTPGAKRCCDAAVSFYGRLRDASDGTSASGDVSVDGRDHLPSGWTGYCPALGAGDAGIRTRRTQDLTIANGVVVMGTPSTEVDATISTNLVRTFGATTYTELANRADIVISSQNPRLDDVRPRSSGSVCTRTDQENWGAPESPGSVCWSYLPIIHVTDDLVLEGAGTGQGILLADGDVDMRNTFRFYGLIVVQGQLIMRDDTVVRGAILIGNRDNTNTQSTIRDEAIVEYSSCALARVLPPSSSAQFLPGRHWFEVP